MYRKGFTLIELLIVIAIIGILSSVILNSTNSARLNARDSLRLQNMKQLYTALQLYYSEYGQCPSLPPGASPNNISSTNSTSWNSSFTSSIRPFMSSLPASSNSLDYSYSYAYGNGSIAFGFFLPSGLQYSCVSIPPGGCYIGVLMENSGHVPSDNTFGKINGNTYYNLIVGPSVVSPFSNVAFCSYTSP